MKKVFIGLLIVVVAGAGIFFALRSKNQSPVAGKINQEQIVGNWKLVSLEVSHDSVDIFGNVLLLLDSNLRRYNYEFRKDQSVAVTLGDSVAARGGRYEWQEPNRIVWKEHAADSTGESFQVAALTADSLVLRGQDSAVLYFTKNSR
ncbi:MAG: hypothetical protein ABW019_17655 [Chitinophagaceae bacterium]